MIRHSSPEGTSKLHEKVTQMPMVPTPATLPSLSQSWLMVSWGVPYDQLIEEEKSWAWFTDVFAQYLGTIWKWTVAALEPLSGTSLKDNGKGKSSQQAEFKVLLGRRNNQMCNYILIHVLWPMVWMDDQRLGRNMIGKLVTKKSRGKSMWVDLSEWAKNVKIFVSHVNAHQRVASAEKDFNNQVDRITFSVDTSQPLSPATLS